MSQIEILEAARREYDEDEVQLDVLKILEPGNEFLQEIVDQFGRIQRQVNKAVVACFYELKSTNLGKIVGKQNRKVSLKRCFERLRANCMHRDLWSARALAVSTCPIRRASTRSHATTSI